MSWLAQSRPADEIIVVDDASTDNTPHILAEFGDKITVVRTPVNLGNKSYAQEFGLRHITGDVFISTDGDTLLHKDFIKNIEKDFKDPKVAAVGGYVKSLKYNWLTRHRAFEYAIGQNFHKLAQSYLDCLYVIPGAAGAFRTNIFRTYLSFDHDTIAEDLDFTYKLHRLGFRLIYDRDAIVYTQDPATLKSYINQMRRWYGGGWQNLIKNYDIVAIPPPALMLSLMYAEGFAFAVLLLIMPFLNLFFSLLFISAYCVVAFFLSFLAALKEKRADLMLTPLPQLFLLYLNAYLFLERFVQEVVLQKRNLIWFTPERTSIT